MRDIDDGAPVRGGLSLATVAFVALTALTAFLLFGQLSVHRCFDGEPAGCGMSKGFTALFTWAAALVAGLAALLYLVRHPTARTIAWGIGSLTFLYAAVFAIDTISTNLRRTGRIDGIDPERFKPQPEAPLRAAVRCVLAGRVRKAEDAVAARAFDDIVEYYEGKLQILQYDVDRARLPVIAREEAAKLKAEGEPYAAIATCADGQIGTSDLRELLLDQAGLDAGELKRQRRDAYTIRGDTDDPTFAPREPDKADARTQAAR